jgi:hypothetical protein
MHIFSRRFLIGALTLLVLTSSCNLPAQNPPSSIGTILPTEQVISTIPPAMTATALIPVTGLDVVTLQCQFCVNDEAHALLTLGEDSAFNVSDPSTGVTCLTAQVMSGQRVLICRGAQAVSFNLNVCPENANCVQFPVTLQTCPLIPSTGIGTPRATLTPVRVFPTPTNTFIPPAISTTVPTQIALSPTSTAAVRLPFTATSPVITQVPGSGLQDPATFIRWYFTTVWKDRNYQDLWDHYLTPHFKSKVGSGVYQDYVNWWDSVKRVDVNSVDVLANDGTHATVRVNLTFSMKDGRVVPNQEYAYDLLYDSSRGTWMFD